MSDEALSWDEAPQAFREAHDSLKKKYADLEKEVNSFRTERRTSTLASTLKAKGIDEAKAAKVAKFYQGDDTSEGAVSKWLEEYADVFGITPTEQAPATPPVDPNAAAANRLQAATASTQPATPGKVEGQVMGDPTEIAELIKTLPYEELVTRFGFPPRN